MICEFWITLSYQYVKFCRLVCVYGMRMRKDEQKNRPTCRLQTGRFAESRFSDSFVNL